MKLRYLPNMLSLSRIVLTIALIFINPPLGLISFIVYCIAGLTDLFDGPLARRIPGGKTKIGADLDSFADLFMVIVGIFVIMPAMEIWSVLWFSAIGILIFRVLTASISGLYKHKKILLVHTLSSKLGSLLLFIGPILYFIIGEHIIINIYVVFIIVWQLLVSIEEALINILTNKPNTNIKGFWKIKEENAK